MKTTDQFHLDSGKRQFDELLPGDAPSFAELEQAAMRLDAIADDLSTGDQAANDIATQIWQHVDMFWKLLNAIRDASAASQ